MVKALLNAPACKVQNGFAELFTHTHFSSLTYPKGNNVKLATEAGEHMVTASSFMQAYCKLGDLVIDKFLADLEVRFVMHVLKIQVPTRKSFPSLIDIMQQLWLDVKALDPHLPQWPILPSTSNTSASPVPRPARIQELHEDGKISNDELYLCNFILGALVTDESGDPYKIVSLGDALLSLIHI